MIVCRDVAWIHCRQTQWYKGWHFAICLSPINVFLKRFLVPSPPLLPNTHVIEQSPTWERCWAWAAELEAISSTCYCRQSSYTASPMASRSQLVQRPQARERDMQCRGHLGVHYNSISLGVSTVLKSWHLHTRRLKKGKETGIQTFQVTERKCKSLRYRLSSYQIRVLTCWWNRANNICPT